MTDFKNLDDRTDEFRFGKGGRSSVLQFRELINNYRVVGVDHEGTPFRMSIGIWNSLELATEDDFRRLAQAEPEPEGPAPFSPAGASSEEP